nr:MAG TPA: hypothetical protein [Inoviridae sp.]
MSGSLPPLKFYGTVCNVGALSPFTSGRALRGRE